MEIPALGQLITKCWTRAEETLQDTIRNKFADRDEEIITTLFHAELEAKFATVSSNGAVARAFLSDLRLAFPTVSETTLFQISGDLIATVSFHPRHIERATGADFGLVLIRPDVQRVQYQGSALTIEHNYKRGLLIQAKVLQRNSRWKGLSSHQKRVLPKKLSYLALLLYQYLDQHGDRRLLAPFAWQLALNATIKQISSWLASGQFPELHDSRRILGRLLQDHIGTDNKEIIAKDIAPRMRPSLEIKIHWKDGRDPGSTVHLYDFTSQKQRQVLLQRVC